MSAARLRSRVAATFSPFDRPLTSYYLIIGTGGLLLAIGLVMVLSTSSAMQLDAGQSPYSAFLKQFLGALFGLVVMWTLAKAPVRLFRVVAYPLLITAVVGLLLVLAFGRQVDGAQRWLVIGGNQFQPSEFAKLAFLLWGADLLARKEQLGQLNDWRMLLIPLLPGAAVLGLLVILGHDIGTTFLLLVVLLALLWVIGTPARLFAGILGLIIFALLLLVVTTRYADSRLTGYLTQAGGPTGPNMQSIQGKWAIGSGGLFGVGLGNSQEKWGWVPEASTDFIFAILGEELGLIGTACVVLLYGGLAYAGLRVARRVTDPFMRLAAAGATAWIAGQALVNICAVVGLLPITGVPLPLISQGLSSVLATMAALGMLLSFARCEPGAREALAAAGRRRRRRIPAAFRRDEDVTAAATSAAGQTGRRPQQARSGQMRQNTRSRLASHAARSGTPSPGTRRGSPSPGAWRGSPSPASRPGPPGTGSGPGVPRQAAPGRGSGQPAAPPQGARSRRSK